MKMRPIHFVPDLADAVRLYEALDLEPESRSRSGRWIELTAAGGELGLHDAAMAAEVEGREGLALNCRRGAPRGGRAALAGSRLRARGHDR